MESGSVAQGPTELQEQPVAGRETGRGPGLRPFPTAARQDCFVPSSWCFSLRLT